MNPLNVPMNEALEHDLRQFMRMRDIKTESEAVRIAIKEGLESAYKKKKPFDFGKLLGKANAFPQNPNPRFKSDDDLWRK